MIKSVLIMILLALGAVAPGWAQAAKMLGVEETIRNLVGRWEYRAEDGWGDTNIAEKVGCKGAAERIWFERNDEGLVYHSQKETPGSKLNTSRVGFQRSLFSALPPIRIQYEGEQRLDEKGKPVVWEIYMAERDTFYWHRVDWPPGATTAPVRRCKEQVTS